MSSCQEQHLPHSAMEHHVRAVLTCEREQPGHRALPHLHPQGTRAAQHPREVQRSQVARGARAERFPGPVCWRGGCWLPVLSARLSGSTGERRQQHCWGGLGVSRGAGGLQGGWIAWNAWIRAGALGAAGWTCFGVAGKTAGLSPLCWEHLGAAPHLRGEKLSGHGQKPFPF